MLVFPETEFDAYLFDCDGTLANSMPVHYRAWQEALKIHEAPYEFPEELFYQLGGTATGKVPDILNERFGGDLESEEVAHTKEKLYLENLHEIKPIQAVTDFAREVVKRKPACVVSGGFANVVKATLEVIGMEDFFPEVITPADVKHGKPAPDMFLLAAERLQVDPKRCLVLEDGIPGVQGASAAGMATFFIPRVIDMGGNDAE